MKLLIDATVAGGRMTGVERYTGEVSGRLARLCADRGDAVLILVRRGMAERWQPAARGGGVTVLESPTSSQLATQQVWIPAMLSRAAVDTAFFPGFPPSPLVFARSSTRVIRTIFDAVMWSAPDRTSRKNKLYYKPLETFGSRRYARIHTISRHAQSEIESCLPWTAGRIEVSGCGVTDLCKPDPVGMRALGIDGLFVLFVGTIEPRKNLPFLLDVFGRLRTEHPALKLVLAGRPGWGMDAVRERIAALELERAVVMTGAVSEAVLCALYREARLLVYPSLHEGFGLPVVEAMRYGLPVVSSDAAALPEVGGDATVRLPPDRLDAWANAVSELLGNEAQRHRMTEAGVSQARHFEWDAVARRIASAL